MPDLQQTARSIAEYLGSCGLDPPLREISLDPARQPAAFPHLRIAPGEVSTLDVVGTNYASYHLSLASSAGRPEDALVAAAALAEAVRRKLSQSHGLGGFLGAIVTQTVRQGDQVSGDAGCLAWAEIDVDVFFTG